MSLEQWCPWVICFQNSKIKHDVCLHRRMLGTYTKSVLKECLSPNTWHQKSDDPWGAKRWKPWPFYFHGGNSSGPWRPSKCLGKFRKMQSSMTKLMEYPLRSPELPMEKTDPWVWFGGEWSWKAGSSDTLSVLEPGFQAVRFRPKTFESHLRLHKPSDMDLEQRFTKVAATPIWSPEELSLKQRCSHLTHGTEGW